MVAYNYLDTSALVKHYITERGSRWVTSRIQSHDVVVITSALTRIEAICAFARRRREGLLTEGDLADIRAIFNYDLVHRYQVAVTNEAVLEEAEAIALRQPLRAYDAVQLATALLVNRQLTAVGDPDITFVCADSRLVEIATTEGLQVKNPNDEP